jgi:hypothetical protein
MCVEIAGEQYCYDADTGKIQYGKMRGQCRGFLVGWFD